MRFQKIMKVKLNKKIWFYNNINDKVLIFNAYTYKFDFINRIYSSNLYNNTK